MSSDRGLIQHLLGEKVFATSLPFSPAVRAGDFVFLSGMASADENGQIVPDTFENEAHRTYKNIARVLASTYPAWFRSGATWPSRKTGMSITGSTENTSPSPIRPVRP